MRTALLAVVLSGCSIVAVRPLPAGYDAREPPHCTTGMAAPVIDGFMGGIVGGATYLAVGNYDDTGGGLAVDAAIVDGGAVALTYVVAAIWGEDQVGKCRRAGETYAIINARAR